MRGGKHVKVKERRRQDILRFRADARKLILGSIGTPTWLLKSVNHNPNLNPKPNSNLNTNTYS